jgi:UDP:flavonoid glycosyltransferase YjiC (YdhE family)
MHANLVAIGSHGDVLPFIALGAELRRRGHQVTLATAEPFANLARQQGLRFEPLATTAQYEALVSNADLWTPIAGLRRLIKTGMHLLRPTYDFAMRQHVRGDTITVASTLAMGARIAQERHGIPLVTVHLAPFLFSSRFELPRLPGVPLPSKLPRPINGGILHAVDRYFLDPLCEPVNGLRADLELPPVEGIARTWWNSPDRVIAMFPAWFARPQPDWPAETTQVDFPAADLFGDRTDLGAPLERFLADGDRPVAFTFGTAMMQDDALARTAFELCRLTGQRGLIVSPHAHAVPPDLAGRVLQVGYVPFSALLPRCTALVHHGGIGTVTRAMAAGLPQLLVPLGFDQFDQAARVRRLGIGLSVRRSAFTARRAARALRHLLACDLVRRRCGVVAARLQGRDGVRASCDAIERVPMARGL